MLLRVSPRSAFMSAFEACTYQACGDNRYGSFPPGTSLKILTDIGFIQPLKEDEVYLCKLRVREQRCGYGTQAMCVVTSLADQFGVSMYVDAVPQDLNKTAISLKKLKAFYAGFRFMPTGVGDQMYRCACNG